MADLIALEQWLLAFTSTTDAVLPLAIRVECVNEAVRIIQRAHPFRGFEVSADTTYPANAAAITLPTDFISEKQVLQRDTTTSSDAFVPIEKVDRDYWYRAGVTSPLRDAVYPQIASTFIDRDAFGTRYSIWAGGLYLLPTPTMDTPIRMDFIKVAAELVNSNDANHITTTYPDLARTFALVEAYKYLQEDERAATWDERAQRLLLTAITHDKTTYQSGATASRGV